jgi:hypothetical protein
MTRVWKTTSSKENSLHRPGTWVTLSHMDEAVVIIAIKLLHSIYGDDIRVSRGKVHDYIGMHILLIMRADSLIIVH